MTAQEWIKQTPATPDLTHIEACIEQLSAQCRLLEQQMQTQMHYLSDLIRWLDAPALSTTARAVRADRHRSLVSSAEEALAELEYQTAELREQLSALARRTTRAAERVEALVPSGRAAGDAAWAARHGATKVLRRGMPSLNGPIVDSLAPGTSVTLQTGPVFADDRAWWHIRTADGSEGWVQDTDLITIS